MKERLKRIFSLYMKLPARIRHGIEDFTLAALFILGIMLGA